MLIRYSILFALLLSTNIGFSQLTLKNVTSGKEKTLKEGGDIRLSVNMDRSGYTYGKRILDGQLVRGTDKRVKIIPAIEEQHITLDNGLRKVNITEYDELKGLQALSIEVPQLEAIAYRSHFAKKLERTGRSLTIIGSISALLVAPLVSIDYKNGDFDKDRYFLWAGSSLAATGLGVGILIGSGKKKYQIKAPGQTTSSKQWTIIAK